MYIFYKVGCILSDIFCYLAGFLSGFAEADVRLRVDKPPESQEFDKRLFPLVGCFGFYFLVCFVLFKPL